MTITKQQEFLIRHTFIDFAQTLEFLRNPLIFTKAKGLYYWDIEGKRYFDGIGGIYVASLGHLYPRVIDAIKAQLDRMTFCPPLHGISDVTLDFIKKMGSATSDNLSYVKSFSGGSEAVEAAFKFTRQYFKQSGYPGKYKVISAYRGFHGSTAAAMSASGTGKRKTPFEPQMAGFVKVMPPLLLRDNFSSWEECNRFAAQIVEDTVIGEDPDTVAAIIMEPISNTGWVATPTREYFKILRTICDKYKIMLIFDEICSGVGKTGNMFAYQTYDVEPDIFCCGKGLTSGTIPIGAMVAREQFSEAFLGPLETNIQFAHGHTFAGNPLACAAGIAVIDEILEKKLTYKARENGEYLFEKLESLKKYDVIREVRGKGIWLGVEFMKDPKTKSPFPELGIALRRTALDNRLIIRVDPNWFAVAPALIAEKSDIDEMFELIQKSFKQALELARK
jgi:adenosylmethionine-8-amino-7-oxononanoate aminotransferase